MEEVINKETQPQIHLNSIVMANSSQPNMDTIFPKRQSELSILSSFHAGYFRICLSLCSQTLLWKTVREPTNDTHVLRHVFRMLPSTAILLLWLFSLLTVISFSLLYLLRCFFHFNMVKEEFLHHVGVNYLFAPWISWLLLLQCSPFVHPEAVDYLVLWWVFIVPVLALDVKIYGQWFTKGKRFLSAVANPTSQLSVIANLAGARAAALMGWEEIATCMFSLGMAHYLVLFVTLYQRFAGCETLPAMLRPVFFLFIAAPSMACLAWDSISGRFDMTSKMLFFLSMFLFTSLISRPHLFKKSMRKFHVAWWAYSYPLTILALASTEYAQEVKGTMAHLLMLALLALSLLVSIALMVFTAFNARLLLSSDDPFLRQQLPTSAGEKSH